jgi:predicted nucleic acid-binding protein
VIYLDTSALVKLVRVERESTELADWLDERTELRWITSTLAEVELPRALIRAGQLAALAAVPAVLARLDRFEMDSVVRATAAAFQDPSLRSLDAIHLATADVAASVATLAAFVTYNRRLSDAARVLNMPTVAPGTN